MSNEYKTKIVKKDKVKRDNLKKELKDMEDYVIPRKSIPETGDMIDEMTNYCPHVFVRDAPADTVDIESWICPDCGCQDFRPKGV